MRKIIFYQTVTQYENTGDLIINKSLVSLLKKHGEIIANDRGVPEWYLDDIGINNSERLSERTSLRFDLYLLFSTLIVAFNRKIRLYLVSGPGHFYGSSINKSFKNIISGLLFFFLKLLGCRIVKCGVSLGPLSNHLAFSEAFRSNYYHKYLIRDKLSIELANRVGIKNDGYFPDLAWSLKLNDKNKFRKTSNSNKNIFLSFRSSVIEDGNSEHYLDEIKSSLDIILKYLHDKRSFEKIMIGYQVDRDLEVSEMLFDYLKNKFQVEMVKNKITLESAREIYANTRFCISNRLHVLLYSFKYGSLPISLTDTNKHLKITGIFKDSGLDDLLVDVKEEEKNILRSINDIYSRENQILKKLRDNEIKYHQQTETIIKSVFS